MHLRSFTYSRFIVVALFSICAVAQQPAQAPAIPTTGFAGLDQYRASRIAVFTDDYGQLARYREANAALPAPATGENRVVFFGDSITDIWKLADSFPGKPYVNRGIGGQTTPQMLVRFRQDVIDLHPKVVVILAGTYNRRSRIVHGAALPDQAETEAERVHAARVVVQSLRSLLANHPELLADRHRGTKLILGTGSSN